MKKLYASALLSDGELIAWNVGPHDRKEDDYYKDFCFGGMDMLEYFESHEMSCRSCCCDIANSEETEYFFDHLSTEFYKQFKISKDFLGDKPY